MLLNFLHLFLLQGSIAVLKTPLSPLQASPPSAAAALDLALVPRPPEIFVLDSLLDNICFELRKPRLKPKDQHYLQENLHLCGNLSESVCVSLACGALLPQLCPHLGTKSVSCFDLL